MLRLLSFGLCLIAAGSAFAADRVFPRGSRIGLVPPADMDVQRGLTGFRNVRTGASILAIEMPPDAFPSLAATLSDDALKMQGFALKGRDAPTIGSTKAILVTGEQTDNGRTVQKTLLLAADPGMTALVVGQLPQGASPQDLASLEAALKTVAFRSPLTIDEQVASLPFRIGDIAGFRPIRAMAGNSILLTDGPSDVIREAAQPVLIVAQSFGPPPAVEQREAFARQALISNNFIKDAVIERSQPFRQAGGDWHEIVAKAKEMGSGMPVVVMQTIRFDRDGYMRSIGIVRAEDRDGTLPRFRKLVDSIRPE